MNIIWSGCLDKVGPILKSTRCYWKAVPAVVPNLAGAP